ncbi:hypothetical protein EG359_22370 (plasmid) [Chryseobacterium joostei]|uniref:Relaxase/Mobilisation nuclease domain-containing protein n=1 Tax=Chryseobacterium joostei TaxID=112234 RepID=A0A1N7KGK0_9FLAO|nr:relaxase/mobilization nuclease domain-containing protein [Chryseobacterium joostei]AZB02406.1 hypothetical protein EG359_22370 [Chryseobacterium joostei]SIS60736.1 Relaxase/Mobilisation nuclease domain-containing protein [Chryseobacterium joostei]
MIGNLTHVGTLESLTNYHFKKIEEGVAEKLYSQGIDDNSKKSVELSFKAISKLDDSMADPYVHLSLNFPIEDKEILTNEKMEEITRECLEKLGYGEQPVWAVRHHDQDHPHIHIITHSIKDDGTKVSRNWEQYRLMEINRGLEKKHGLRIVSSIKKEISIDKKNHVELNKSADYKNYLTQSVKEVMTLKPRRFNDFQQILKEKYHIETYVSNKKNFTGVSFAVTDKVKGRYVEEKGTLAVSGSDLSKKFSHPKLKESIQGNFENASKNYGKLLSFQARFEKELKVFEKIKIEDFNNYSKSIEIIKNEKTGYIFIDKVSKNAFNSNDLKKLDTSKLSEETKVELSPELKNKIYTEALFAYRNDMKAQGFTSSFVQDIYQKENIFNYLEVGKQYNELKGFLTDKENESLRTYFSEKNRTLDKVVESFQEQEKEQRRFDKETYYSFTGVNNIAVVEKLFNPKEPLPFEVQNTLKGIRNITEKIEERAEKLKETNEPEKEKKEKLPDYQVKVTKDIYFAHEKLFKIEELQGEYRTELEKLINKEYGIDTKNRAFKTEMEPEKVLEYLNKHGIEIVQNGANLSAKIEGYTEPFLLKGLEQDFLKPLGEKLNHQEVENDKEVIKSRLAIEDKIWSRVNIEILPETEREILKSNEDWKIYTEDKEHNKLLNDSLYFFIREAGVDYRSTLLENMSQKKTLFAEGIAEVVKEQNIPAEKIEKFVDSMSTQESINKAESSEKKNIERNINLAAAFENPAALLALQGYRSQEIPATEDRPSIPGITEKTGKHTVETKMKVDAELQNYIAENNVYKFYSPLIRDMVQQVSGNEGKMQLPEKMLVVEEIKDKLPEKDVSLLKGVAERDYIDYYFNKSIEEDIQNKQEYLNSKGIQVDEQENGSKLSLVNSSTAIEKEEKIKVDSVLQENILKQVGKDNPEQAQIHRKIHTLIESENYVGVAMELRNNGLTEKDIFFTKNDEPRFQELGDSMVLNEAFSTIVKEQKASYHSDLLEYISVNKDLSLEKFKELTQDHKIDDNKIKDFIEKISSPDAIEQAIMKEKMSLDANFTLSKTFENPAALLALQGFRNDEGGVTEKTGKYTMKTDIKIDSELQKFVAENNVYKFYSPVIKDMVNEVSGNEGKMQIPDKMLVVEEIKDKLPEKDISVLKGIAEKNYIDYYFNKAITNDIPNKQEYLNSKGIHIEEKNSGIKLSLVNSSNATEKSFQIKTDVVLQEKILNHFGKGNEEKAQVNRKINILTENGNFKGAAFELKKNGMTEKDMFFTSADKANYQSLKESLKSIGNNQNMNHLTTVLSGLITTNNLRNKKPNIKKGNNKSKGKSKY